MKSVYSNVRCIAISDLENKIKSQIHDNNPTDSKKSDDSRLKHSHKY